jgi:hypothetical protein
MVFCYWLELDINIFKDLPISKEKVLMALNENYDKDSKYVN